MSEFVIRPASQEEFATAIEWAALEGWNPGLDDLEAFHSADPDGFLMGWLDDVAVSSISVVRYGKKFGFLGFYIVLPEFRGRGIGLATWNAGMAHLGNRNIALDGVVDQQSNYRKSGFAYVAGNIRYAGRPAAFQPAPRGLKIQQLDSSDLPALMELDRQCYPADRSTFLANWCLPTGVQKRTTHIAESDEKFVGFGTIRMCREGHKIGPLFAETKEAATALLHSLSAVASSDEIIIDVPLSNPAAVKLARDNRFAPVFETARMVRGTPADIKWDKVFGITTFELG